jgi:hypothetical protein
MKNENEIIETEESPKEREKSDKPLPKLTTIQRVEIGIRCALTVCKDDKFRTWAENWLSGEDRSAESAWMAARAAETESEKWAAMAADWAEWEVAARASARASARAVEAAGIDVKLIFAEVLNRGNAHER